MDSRAKSRSAIGRCPLAELIPGSEICYSNRTTMIRSLPSSHSAGIKAPLPQLKPILDAALKTSIEESAYTEAFVYVHCAFRNGWKDALLRIWRTSFLVDQSTGIKSGLVHAENISIAPLWTLISDYQTHHFLLIFSPLPKSCPQFDFIEEIVQPGGFHVRDIRRNQRDVYHIEV